MDIENKTVKLALTPYAPISVEGIGCCGLTAHHSVFQMDDYSIVLNNELWTITHDISGAAVVYGIQPQYLFDILMKLVNTGADWCSHDMRREYMFVKPILDEVYKRGVALHPLQDWRQRRK